MPADWSAHDEAAGRGDAASPLVSGAGAGHDGAMREAEPAPPRRDRLDPALDAGEAGAGAGVMGATTAAEPADAAYETQPASARARRARGPAAAIAAGVAAAAILAGVGWYAIERDGHGLSELTPGAPAAAWPPAHAR